MTYEYCASQGEEESSLASMQPVSMVTSALVSDLCPRAGPGCSLEVTSLFRDELLYESVRRALLDRSFPCLVLRVKTTRNVKIKMWKGGQK